MELLVRPACLARTTIYESRWVNVYVDRVELPGGHIVEEHHLLDFPWQAAVALVTDERGELLFVNVPRYATGASAWELPAGRIEDGETPSAAAEREVLEEGGYRTTGHELVHTFFSLPGIANQQMQVVRCQAVERVGRADPDEVREVSWFSPAGVRQLVASGAIQDGITLAALAVLWAQEM